MPRHVYRPPRGRFSIALAIVAGLVCTALLFLAIPLSQKLADFMAPPAPPEVEIQDTPPPPETVLEEEPPEEEEPEPEPEDMVEEPNDLDLGIELADLPTGTGGGITLNIPKFSIAGSDDGGLSGALDQPPKPVSKPQPQYPPSLLKKGVGGRVQIACKISNKGLVNSAQIRTSSGHGALDSAALKAAKRWKFRPAIRAGKPVLGSVVIPFNFEVRR